MGGQSSASRTTGPKSSDPDDHADGSLLVILFVSLSARLGRVYLTGPIVFMVAGALLGRTVLSGDVDSTVILTIAEVTLTLMLFHDASQLQPRELRGHSGFTFRLLFVGLPLAIGAGYLAARGLFPDFAIWLALLLAAGLGAATVLNPGVPVRVRRILNVESGLNDGLATPVVLFAVAVAAGEGPEHALPEALREIGIGVLFGALVGFLCGRLLERARRSGWAQDSLIPIAALAVPLLCYFGGVEPGGNGYIAAFVAGTAFASAQANVEHTHLSLEMTDQISAFLGYAVDTLRPDSRRTPGGARALADSALCRLVPHGPADGAGGHRPSRIRSSQPDCLVHRMVRAARACLRGLRTHRL